MADADKSRFEKWFQKAAGSVRSQQLDVPNWCTELPCGCKRNHQQLVIRKSDAGWKHHSVLCGKVVAAIPSTLRPSVGGGTKAYTTRRGESPYHAANTDGIPVWGGATGAEIRDSVVGERQPIPPSVRFAH